MSQQIKIKKCLMCDNQFDTDDPKDIFCIDHSDDTPKLYTITKDTTLNIDNDDQTGFIETVEFNLHNDFMQYFKENHAMAYSFHEIDIDYSSSDNSFYIYDSGEEYTVKWKYKGGTKPTDDIYGRDLF